MLNPRLASRYAKSLIDIAKEQGQLDTIYKDMLLLQSIVKNNRDFVTLLRSPIVSSDKKNKIIEAVTTGRISPVTAMFIRLLISKGRESFLPEIIQSFIDQYKRFNNIHTVQLTTATPISEELKSAIVARIRANSSDMQKIELETLVDADLIGGFTLQAGDKLVDASIAYDLRELSREFENNDFIYKLK